MLLVIDIGNSTAKFGVFDHEKLIARFYIPTVRSRDRGELDRSIGGRLDFPIRAAIVASVVPELNDAVRDFCENRFRIKAFFVDSGTDFGLPILYDPPTALGIDRAVAAFAAREKYGSPSIVCDFGTATTIDAVDASGAFLGGVITPGIKTLADSLFQNTSKLPRVEIEKPAGIIGRTTVEAIRAGVFFGYMGLVKEILRKMTEELGDAPQIVATGGFAALIAENADLIEIVDENLLLEGLRLIHEITVDSRQ